VTLALEGAPDHVVTLRLPVPMSDARSLLKLLHLELAGNPPPQPVVKAGPAGRAGLPVNVCVDRASWLAARYRTSQKISVRVRSKL
jgi:hypothetical protein